MDVSLAYCNMNKVSLPMVFETSHEGDRVMSVSSSVEGLSSQRVHLWPSSSVLTYVGLKGCVDVGTTSSAYFIGKGHDMNHVSHMNGT